LKCKIFLPKRRSGK